MHIQSSQPSTWQGLPVTMGVYLSAIWCLSKKQIAYVPSSHYLVEGTRALDII